MWDAIVAILIVLGGIAMLWAISQLLRELHALLKRNRKIINLAFTRFLHFNKPIQTGFQSPLRAVGLRMWLIFSFTLTMDSI